VLKIQILYVFQIQITNEIRFFLFVKVLIEAVRHKGTASVNTVNIGGWIIETASINSH